MIKLPTRDAAKPISADQFTKVMRSVPAAVAVVASTYGDERNGMTATAVCSVSADPAHVLVCINQSAETEALIVKSGRFSVSYLRPEHEDISNLFSKSKLDGESRFALGNWHRNDCGLMVLEDAVAHLICDVVAHHRYGTHSVFVGCVTQAMTSQKDPLIYCDGSYRTLQQAETS